MGPFRASGEFSLLLKSDYQLRGIFSDFPRLKRVKKLLSCFGKYFFEILKGKYLTNPFF